MNAPLPHTLVNFRARDDLLDRFDDVCMLQGRSRTEVLTEMMRSHINTAGPRWARKLSREAAIDEDVRAAAKPLFDRYASVESGERQPLKKFSEFA